MSGLNLKNYKVIRKICRKFCFTVYEALNLIDEKRRFLKVLNGEVSDDTCVANFLDGARVASKLDNKNICKNIQLRQRKWTLSYRFRTHRFKAIEPSYP